MPTDREVKASDLSSELERATGLEVAKSIDAPVLFHTTTLVLEIGLLVTSAAPAAKAIVDLVARYKSNKSKDRCALVINNVEYEVDETDAELILKLLND